MHEIKLIPKEFSLFYRNQVPTKVLNVPGEEETNKTIQMIYLPHHISNNERFEQMFVPRNLHFKTTNEKLLSLCL